MVRQPCIDLYKYGHLGGLLQGKLHVPIQHTFVFQCHWKFITPVGLL